MKERAAPEVRAAYRFLGVVIVAIFLWIAIHAFAGFPAISTAAYLGLFVWLILGPFVRETWVGSTFRLVVATPDHDPYPVARVGPVSFAADNPIVQRANLVRRAAGGVTLTVEATSRTTVTYENLDEFIRAGWRLARNNDDTKQRLPIARSE